MYHDHLNDVKTRAKLRTRKYVDTDLTYIEVKLKEEGNTVKFRKEYPPINHGHLTRDAQQFFDKMYEKQYDNTFSAGRLMPSISTGYQRFTMCNKDYSEKITIDF